MVKNNLGATIGAIGLLTALGLGIVEATGLMDISLYSGAITLALVTMGVLIGVLNIQKKESVSFMLSILVISLGVASLTIFPVIGSGIQIVAGRLTALLIPSAIVVAFGTAYRHAQR